VVPGGYLWWYLDGVSDDGAHGVTVIAFVGSVFSPYYAWAGRGEPENHVCLNVALYGPKARWAMTERGRAALSRGETELRIGPSAVRWENGGLTVEIDEVAVPLPRRIRGRVRVVPDALTDRGFVLDSAGRHRWWPIGPAGRVEVELDAPDLAWSGPGYLDTNAGDEPLEAGFRFWNWARAATEEGALIAYDAERRDGSRVSLGLKAGRDGSLSDVELPPPADLKRGFWGVARAARGEEVRLVRTFEDAPFYTRSQLAGHLAGQPFTAVHESLNLDRFASPVVKLMLPFRMPRRAAWRG
jgi:carotenoid 1,2-hydratase